MEPNKILSAQLIDLVFDDRNKEYGAYELRKTYSRRIKKSLLITTAVAGLAFGGAVLANSAKKSHVHYRISPVVNLTAVKDEKPPEKLPEPEQKPPVEEVQTQKFTPPEIVDDKYFKEPPPSIDDLADSKCLKVMAKKKGCLKKPK